MSKSYDELVAEHLANNFKRLSQGLKSLQFARDGKCVGCDEVIRREGVVMFKPGFWIAPDGFHSDGCPIASVMQSISRESIPEEEELDRQHLREFWLKPENQKMLERVKETKARLEKEIEESEMAKFS